MNWPVGVTFSYTATSVLWLARRTWSETKTFQAWCNKHPHATKSEFNSTFDDIFSKTSRTMCRWILPAGAGILILGTVGSIAGWWQ